MLWKLIPVSQLVVLAAVVVLLQAVGVDVLGMAWGTLQALLPDWTNWL